jgi:acetolactate synthase-1/2/3 large subunit
MATTAKSQSRSDVGRSAGAPGLSGADAILRVLEQAGVEVCFGMPGGAILPLYDAFARGSGVRHVLVRHEQGAGHMAEGYARATGRLGVAIATSGPGATNLVTPIANAAMDSTPLLCITGQVRRSLIGTSAFQECDIVSVTRPLVKGSWLITDPAELVPRLREAIGLAQAGRPGPTLIDVPRDVQEAVGCLLGAEAVELPDPDPDPAALDAVASAVRAAERPVLYVGGGVVNAGATEGVSALVESASIPVVTTLMAKGAIPEHHELSFGCPGMHGGRWANLALNEADLILAVGARFDDRVTGPVEMFAPGAQVAHFDIDPREIGKLRHVDFPVLGALPAGLDGLRIRLDRYRCPDAWLARICGWRDRYPFRYSVAPGLKPQRVVERLDELMAGRPEVVWTTGVGQHQMWAMQYVHCDRPRSFITSGGHGTMGFGLPAAIGAKAGRPDATVVCIDGDGSFQMTAQELATAVSERFPVIVVILNNGHLGMVQQWQTLFYEERLAEVDLTYPTDCAAVARGFGAAGVTVRSEHELDRAVATALESEGPTVIDAHVTRGEGLYPMMAPGAPPSEMLEYEEGR